MFFKIRLMTWVAEVAVWGFPGWNPFGDLLLAVSGVRRSGCPVRTARWAMQEGIGGGSLAPSDFVRKMIEVSPFR